MLYNSRLYDDLKERLSGPNYDPSTTLISDIFTRMKSFLQVYVGYSENYSKAMKAYEVIMSRNTKTRKIVKEAERKAGNVMEAFLILPIQRIPRYILLLKELIQATDAAHPDLQPLRDTVESIKELCAAINEAPRKLQEANELLRVFKCVIPSLPDLLSPGRLFIAQQRIWLINAESVVKSRILFVFNDLLLVTRQQDRHYYLRFRIALPNVEVHDSPPKLLDGKQAYIITLEAAKSKQIVFAFKEMEDKANVMTLIASHNPTIMAGAAGFVPLSERKPDPSTVSSMTASASIGGGGTGISTTTRGSGNAVPSDGASSLNESNSVLASLSGLLTRKNTRMSSATTTSSAATTAVSPPKSTPKSRRLSSAHHKESEFEIVRSPATSSSLHVDPKVRTSISPRAPSSAPMTAESAEHKRIGDLKLKIAQKQVEQQDLHRLVAFHQKYNDVQGESEARANIAKYEAEIDALQREISAIIQAPLVADKSVSMDGGLNVNPAAPVNKLVVDVAATNSKRRHMRQRSLSTTSLPKMSPHTSSSSSEVVAIPDGGSRTGSTRTSNSESASDGAVVTPVAPVSAPPTTVALSVGCTCLALHDFKGANSGELSFAAGDKIVLKSMEGGGDWYLGQLEGKQVGWFPAVGYVRALY
jgi:hypothetical protein